MCILSDISFHHIGCTGSSLLVFNSSEKIPSLSQPFLEQAQYCQQIIAMLKDGLKYRLSGHTVVSKHSIFFFTCYVLSHEDQVWQLSLSLFDCIYRPRYSCLYEVMQSTEKFAEITLVYTLLNKLTVLLFCYRLIRKILPSSK